MDFFFQYLVNGIGTGSAYALLGIAFAIVFSTTRIFHFAFAVLYVLAGYLFYEAWDAGASVLVSALIAVIVSFLLGGVMWVLLYGPLLRRGLNELSLFLVSLGVTTAGESLIAIQFDRDPKRVFSTYLFGSHEITFLPGGSAYVTNSQIMLLVLAIAVGGAVAGFMRWTRAGAAMISIGRDPVITEALGIRIGLLRAFALAAGTAIAAIPAVIKTADVGIQPHLGFQAVLIGIIATFAAGQDSVLGAAVAGMAVGVITNLSSIWFSPVWQDTVAFGMLFVLLALRPNGIFSRQLRRA